MEHLDKKGFVFLDGNNNPYWCRMYGDSPWFLRWHEAQKSWVTYRQCDQMEVWGAQEMSLPENEAQLYHDLHEKFINPQRNKP